MESKKISGCQGMEGRGESVEHRGFFRVVELYSYRIDTIMETVLIQNRYYNGNCTHTE